MALPGLNMGAGSALDGGQQSSGATSHSGASYNMGSRVSGPRGQWPPPFPFGETAQDSGAAGIQWAFIAAAVVGAVWLLQKR